VSDSFDTEPPDPTPSAPDDPSPEAPEQETPSPEIPSPADSYGDADPALRAGFWKLVLLFKLAIIGLTLGSLIAWFRADYVLGGQLLFGGGALFLYGVYRTRDLKRRLDAGEFDRGEADTEAAGEDPEVTER